MNRPIKTYNDLLEEKKFLEDQLLVQKQKVEDNWVAFKHEFEPVGHAFGTLGKFAKSDKTNPLVNMGLQIVGDMFLKNFVLAKAGWLTRMTVPFVMKNYSSHLLADKGKTFIQKLSRILNRRKNGVPIESSSY